MAFIEKLDGPALNLSPEEFEGYMLHRHAPSVTVGRLQRQRIASTTQHQLEELSGRQKKLDQGVHVLKDQLQQWVQAVQAQVDEASAQSALVQKEITTQSELSQMDSSSAHDVVLQKDDIKDQSVLVFRDQDVSPLDSDC